MEKRREDGVGSWVKKQLAKKLAKKLAKELAKAVLGGLFNEQNAAEEDEGNAEEEDEGNAEEEDEENVDETEELREAGKTTLPQPSTFTGRLGAIYRPSSPVFDTPNNFSW